MGECIGHVIREVTEQLIVTCMRGKIAKKGNKFSIREFMEEVRGIMGVPVWFVFTDSRKTRPDNGDNCVKLYLILTQISPRTTSTRHRRCSLHLPQSPRGEG